MTVYIVQQLQANDYCGISGGNEIIGATRHKETAEEMQRQREQENGEYSGLYVIITEKDLIQNQYKFPQKVKKQQEISKQITIFTLSK